MNARRVLEAALDGVHSRAMQPSFPILMVAVFAVVPTLSAEEQPEDAPPTTMEVQDEAWRELISMNEADQKARIEMIQELASAGAPIGSQADTSDPKYVAAMKKASARVTSIDAKNRARLKEVVEQQGWPGISLVGKDGQQAAWLLVQHADADRDFQKACLQLMEAMPDGEVQPRSIAYLTDRILVGEKKPQRYGTQMDGEFKPAPLEDPENVDKRRAEVGLPPLAEYIEMAKVGYQELSTGSKKTDKEREN